ncbi:MAG: KamA family radical SAM protein [Bacteroidales bacterium]|nr:KamA family radical SAM protein [Bacteroidales bacterium]
MDTEPISELALHEDKLQADDEPPSLSAKVNGFNLQLVKPNGQSPNGSGSGAIIPSEQSLEFFYKYYPSASLNDWNDWRWQVRNSIKSVAALKQFLNLTSDELACDENDKVNLPIRITPYYASLLSRTDEMQAIRRSVVPVKEELYISPGEDHDPLCEEHSSPVPNLVHRYPDRALFLITGFCSTYCRYCTRSHMVAQDDKLHLGKSALEPAFEYIAANPAIRDVLLSGGDPLTLGDSYIDYVLSRLRAIPHVEIIRIGTKVPVVLPQRITKSLVAMLSKYHPLFMSIHFTHPDELTPEVAQATARLANAGIPLGSQTVLLKSINDEVQIMKNLMQGLLKLRVRPYYLYQCDPIPGSTHFRTPVEKGLEIIEGLRGHTSGYAIPHFVIDAPGGGGKIPLLPEYFLGKDEHGNIRLRNYENKMFTYPEIE